MKPTKDFYHGAFTAYLISAVLAGNAMGAVIPALNGWGRMYVGLTYPAGFFCTAMRSVFNCSVVPDPKHAQWMFHRNRERR